jgi:hypothetical protein
LYTEHINIFAKEITELRNVTTIFPMKKVVLFLLITALLLPSHHAGAAGVAGEKCKAAGIQKLYKKKSFTCIKLGKKLYWDNGVAIEGKSNTQKAIPANCTIQNFATRYISESGIQNADGQVMFSADITNTSNSQVATQVKVYVEWYDSVGISFKKILLIPRIYPGQKIDFGSADTFQNGGGRNKSFPDEPMRINLRSSCKSIALDSKELINGKFPILSGIAPVTVQDFSDEDYIQFGVSASLIITNIFEKDMVISNEVNPESNRKVNIYGIFKDKFGNILGGYTEYVRGDLQTLEKGETTRLELSLLEFSNPDSEFVDRVATFTYTIIID